MKKQYTLRMSPERMKEVKALAEKEGWSATSILESAAESYLKKVGNEREDIRQP